jgi:protein-tyrosine phosphatase
VNYEDPMNGLDLKPIWYDGHWKTATKLADDLVVGAFVQWEGLARLGWDCVLLAKAAPDVAAPHRKFELIDGTGNDRRRLQEVIAWVCRKWREGRKVAVLCRSGANRAPGVAAAALFVAGRASSVYGANEWMRAHRAEVGHYSGFKSEAEFAAQEMVTISLKPEYL